MKKRFISKLLMATLVVVTMGVFSSCKDYDDDINANSAEIQNLKSQVKALETAKAELTTQLSDANKAITAAQADATQALNDLKKAKEDLTAAISTAKQEAINEAQSRIDAAEARILAAAKEEATQIANAAALQAKLDAIADADAKLKVLEGVVNEKLDKKEFEDILATLATKEGLNEALKPITEQIAALQNVDKDLKAKLDEIYADYVKSGQLATAVADLETKIAAVDTKLLKLINDNDAKYVATFATKAALEEALLQVDANKKAIEALDSKVTNIESNIIPTLALKSELAAAQLALEQAIAKKADQTALDAAVATINETIKTLATKEELANEVTAINNALTEIRTILETKASVAELTAAKNELQGKINELGIKEEQDIIALRSELMGVIEYNIALINTKIEQQIGIVDGRITSEVATLNGTITTNYNTLFGLIQACAQQSDMTYALDHIRDLETNQNNLSITVTNITTQLNSLTTELNRMANELNGLTDLDVEENPSSARLQAGENVNGAVAALKNVLNAMNDKITNMHQYLETTIGDVNSKLDQIKLFVTKNLTSIVYRPEVGKSDDMAYLYGFPVIRALLLEPQSYFEFAWDGDVYKATPSNDKKSKQFDIIAKYWLNPSSTDITKYDWQFDEVAGKNYISRGNEDTDKAGVTANVIGVDKGGILSVALILDKGENVNNANTKSIALESNACYAWITTVALQAVRNDVDLKECTDTVTSDYAIIVPDYYKEILLANNDFMRTRVGGDIVTDESLANNHEEGNREWHLRTDYAELVAENTDDHRYSYELPYNDASKFVDLSNVTLHYNNGTPDAGIMGHNDAIDRGFWFEYEILTNADLFETKEGEGADYKKDDKCIISLTEAARTIESAGKEANVLVKLMTKDENAEDNAYCFAYGFVSILITNKEQHVDVPMPILKLICGNFSSSITWDEFLNLIKAEVNSSFDITKYDVYGGGSLEAMSKLNNTYDAAATGDIAASTLGKNGTNLTWSFTEETVKKVFYNDGVAKDSESYDAYVKFVPKAGNPALADITIKITIPGVVYPEGGFSISDRIQRYWFKQFTDNLATTDEEKNEVHANVEVVDEVDANDEFKFDVTSWFMANKFTFTPTSDFTNAFVADLDNQAQLFFDADKYDVISSGEITNPKEVLTGGSGSEYALFLESRYATTLKATKKDADGKYLVANAEDVVVLTTDATDAFNRNSLVEFKGWQWKEGDVPSYANAQDLLNNASHSELGAKETFTTHMILTDDGTRYCLPINLTGPNTFDIRYLRPLSANKTRVKTFYDAIDGGTDASKIYLAELIEYIDWRKTAFTAQAGVKYLNYYGVKRIEADFDNARTNLAGQANLDAEHQNQAANWPLLKDVTTKMRFLPSVYANNEIAEGASETEVDNSGTVTKTFTPRSGYGTRSYETFKKECGYFLYENNSGNVGTFQIYLPITITYDWGKTKAENVLITIERTKGQDITSRRN
jgi:hypothetical protein